LKKAPTVQESDTTMLMRVQQVVDEKE
jgi:hypothetical protein